MSFRRILLSLASAVLGAVVVIVLLHFSNIDVRATVAHLLHGNRVVLLRLLLLNALLIWLSTVKWRMIDDVLRQPAEVAPSRLAAFFVTSAGMALGLVLPVQIGMSVSRTVGTHFYGRAVQRGTGGTLLEQSFDFLIMIVLALASLFTWVSHGHGWMWIASAVVVIVVALALVPASIRGLGGLCQFAAADSPRPSSPRTRWINRLRSTLQGLYGSGLLDVRLARRLLLISAARFLVLVLMALCAARAAGVPIHFWCMAASMPFAALANLVGVTPGGVGVNELASVTALHIFGTPIQAASQWALANRLLVTSSCIVVAGCAFLLLGGHSLVRAAIHRLRQQEPAKELLDHVEG